MSNRRSYKRNHPKYRAHLRERRLLVRYGINSAGYNMLYNEQNGRCEICKIPASDLSYPLVVDHDHKTRAVRGLLCKPCNNVLGMFWESVERFEAAINYLRTRPFVM